MQIQNQPKASIVSPDSPDYNSQTKASIVSLNYPSLYIYIYKYTHFTQGVPEKSVLYLFASRAALWW